MTDKARLAEIKARALGPQRPSPVQETADWVWLIEQLEAALEREVPPRDQPCQSYDFEVWQDGMMVASAIAGNRNTALAEARHYAAVYSQDGPVTIYEVRREPIL